MARIHANGFDGPLKILIASVILTCIWLRGETAFGESEHVILAFGDSLTAGYGVAADETYPHYLQEMLRQNGYPHTVINGGVSGDTTAGGLGRIDWLLRRNPRIVILALGANDGLRGLPPDQMFANLKKIIAKCREKNAAVLLVGMKALPNYGEVYGREFEDVFPRLSRETGVPLLPFMLEGVAARREFTQGDGLHPLGPGYRIVAKSVWKYLQPLLR